MGLSGTFLRESWAWSTSLGVSDVWLWLDVRTGTGCLEDLGADLNLSPVDESGDLRVSVLEVFDVGGVIVPFMPFMTSSATCRASAWRLGTFSGGCKS